MRLKYILTPIFLLVTHINIFSQDNYIDEIVFQNQSFDDIFISLSHMAGVTILSDETVQGYTSYYFIKTDFLSGFENFLEAHNLYYTFANNIYRVSRIKIEYDEINKTITMKADDVDNKILINALAKVTNTTILMENIPQKAVSIHAKNLSIEDILEILLRQTDGYKIEINDHYYYIKSVNESFTDSMFVQRSQIKKDTETQLYSANIESARLSDLLYDLFSYEEKEYAMMFRGDSTIENFRHYNKDFETLLKLLLEKGNADYTIVGQIYHIFEVAREDILKRLKLTKEIRLTFIDIEDAIRLLPSGLLDQSKYKLLKANNSIFITGNAGEISYIEKSLKSLDMPMGERTYYKIALKYITKDDVVQLIGDSGLTQMIAFSDPQNIVILATKDEYKKTIELLSAIDFKSSAYPIYLRFIRSDELVDKLPPSVTMSDIQLSLNPNIIYFKGSQEKKELFLQELKLIDKPQAQIKYDILVIQYQSSEIIDWNKRVDIGVGNSNTVTGDLGNIIGFKFDVISSLGLNFAMNLDLSIRSNEALVLADTQLNALYGKEVKFQNTTTSRYAVREIDPETGRPLFSSKIQEVTSGLIININGWVSGDQMITMEVNATISREGSVSNPEIPPTTYEKILNTNVRTPSGKPIVIGGLIQYDDETNSQGLQGKANPILDNINSRKEHTEFVIYIIPHLEIMADDRTLYSQKMEDMLNFIEEILW